jgi:hypothetical protein
MQQFAQELVDLHLDLILSHNTPTTAALLRHTRTIPIVFAVVAKAQPSRRALLLSSTGKQLAAVCRINALWRLHCCALGVCGFGEGRREAQICLARLKFHSKCGLCAVARFKDLISLVCHYTQW